MKAWELRRCTNPTCGHEYPRARKPGRAFDMPCTLCKSAMLTIALQTGPGRELMRELEQASPAYAGRRA